MPVLMTILLKEFSMSIYSHRTLRRGNERRSGLLWTCLLGMALFMAGCQSQPPVPTPEAMQSTPVDGPLLSGVVTEIDAYPPEQTTGPVRLQIPEIDLDIPVIAMGWRIDLVEGQRATVWDVPLDEAGWHINSVGAGGRGNTIISGRQTDGAAVFAPLALGAVVPEQQVLLTDGDGITFVYRITEVSNRVPIIGATAEESAQAALYFAPTTTAKLTLVTGWPDFTTTHRIFAVAEFEGLMR